jgi:hypothetical protein
MLMNLDIDFLMELMRKNSFGTFPKDLGEQEAPVGDTSSAPSGKAIKKWETGLVRGKANQVANTKWESGRKLGKTYMNDPKYVWKSERNMGKTGGSDFA